MTYWLVISIFILIIAIWWLLGPNGNHKKLQAKSAERGPISKSQFTDVLLAKGYEKVWIQKLYDRVLVYVPKLDFTMSPDDSLVNDYRIHEPDILDIADELYEERNGKRATDEEFEMAEQIGATIYTFEGLLKFIERKFYQ